VQKKKHRQLASVACKAGPSSSAHGQSIAAVGGPRGVPHRSPGTRALLAGGPQGSSCSMWPAKKALILKLVRPGAHPPVTVPYTPPIPQASVALLGFQGQSGGCHQDPGLGTEWELLLLVLAVVPTTLGVVLHGRGPQERAAARGLGSRH